MEHKTICIGLLKPKDSQKLETETTERIFEKRSEPGMFKNMYKYPEKTTGIWQYVDRHSGEIQTTGKGSDSGCSICSQFIFAACGPGILWLD